MIRWLAIVACALTVCITAASAFLRHSQSGLDCPDWPRCERVADPRGSAPADERARAQADTRGQADAQARAQGNAQARAQADAQVQARAQAPAQPPAVRAARALHRVSAMLVGVLVLLIAVFGWSSLRTDGRVALAFALADTIFLAWLGRFTPHPVPLVTIGNLLGGIALAAAFAWIAASLRSRMRDGVRGVATPAFAVPVFVALALLAAAGWIGTMIGAHDAIGVCEGARCAGPMRVEAGTLDPLRVPQALDAAAARGLHWLHRFVAVAFAAVALFVAARARRNDASLAAALLVVLIVAQVATGVGTAIGLRPLATATLHNALAALLAVVLAALAARSGAAASLTRSGLVVRAPRA